MGIQNAQWHSKWKLSCFAIPRYPCLSTAMKPFYFLFKTRPSISLLILRIVLGAVFLPHGAQKVLGWFGGHGFAGTMAFFTQNMHIPAVLAFLAIAAEFGGAIALFLGLFTRIAALGIAADMVVVVAMVHWQNGFFMNWSGNQKGRVSSFISWRWPLRWSCCCGVAASGLWTPPWPPRSGGETKSLSPNENGAKP